MGQYENDGSVAVNVAKVLLLLVNMAFFVGGGLLIFFAQRVRGAGWLDAFADSDYAWVGDTTLLLVLALGALVLALAALGCAGAWLRNRVLLTVYAGVLLVTAALFAVVAVGAHSVKSRAQRWASAAFPADAAEGAVGANFNQLYCYAQVSYYCAASAQDLTTLFGLNVPAAAASALLGSYSLTALCGVDSTVAKPAQFDALCQVCALVNKYSSYAPVADWAAESCPRSAPNQLWCGTFLLATHGSSNSTATPETFATGSPYNECRGAFLDLVAKWSNFLFGSALVVAVSTVAVFGFSCLVRQGTNRPYLDDSFVVDSPDRA